MSSEPLQAAPPAPQFDAPEQRRAAVRLGLWLFLVTEAMLFGGALTVFTVYRAIHVEAFERASRRLDILAGSVNTAVLIASSFTMAMAVRAASAGRRRALPAWLGTTMALGAVFLAIKFSEYARKFEEGLVPGHRFGPHGPFLPEENLFFSFYFTLTGLHAAHMIAGMCVLAGIAWLSLRGRIPAAWDTPVEMSGLYWHFVDIVWIFLFPLLYLAGGRHP